MEVLLIEPPPEGEFGTFRVLASIGSNKADWAWPPYDLLIIGGLLDKHRIDYEILDALTLNYTYEQLVREIKSKQPKMVVFTTTVPTFDKDVITAKAAKEADSNILTVAFNLAMPSAREDLLAKHPYLDVLVLHEAEFPILNLVKNNFNPKDIAGIRYRRNGEIIENPPQPICKNLDEFGIPAQHKIPLDVFKLYKDPLSRRKPLTLVVGSRGCINQCHHCLTKYLNPLRLRSVENVMEELRLCQKIGIKEVKFLDCTLTSVIPWANKLFQKMIDEDLDLTWSCNTRADRLPPDTIKLMKKAGCHTVCFGADSANQNILDNIGKNLTVEQIETTFWNLKKAGMRTMIYSTFGHKGETMETMRQTIDFVKRLNPDIVSFGIVTPIYGTKFYEYLEREGYLNNVDISEYNPSKPPVYSYPHLSAEDIYKMSIRGYREFYLRPRYIFRRLFTTPNLIDDIKRFIYFMKLYVITPFKKNKNA